MSCPPRPSRPTEEHQAQLDQAAHRGHVEGSLNRINRQLTQIDTTLYLIVLLLIIIAIGVWVR